VSVLPHRGSMPTEISANDVPQKKESSYDVSLEGHGDAPFAIIARATGSGAVTIGGGRFRFSSEIDPIWYRERGFLPH